MTQGHVRPRGARGALVTAVAAAACLVLVASGCGERGEDGEIDVDKNTALKIELLDRGHRDQAVRDSVFGKGTDLDSAAVRWMQQVDMENTTWLKELVAREGWPTTAKVGAEASKSAFLILQHAVHDPGFQRMMLDTISTAYQAGEVDGQSYALLYDRVTVQSGGKQRYGTQMQIRNERIVFDPIEDSSKVDSLRASVGLPPLAEYRRVLDSVYFGKKK
jgi:hypothetical protein